VLQLKVQVFDDGVVMNGQVHQHGRDPRNERYGYLYSAFIAPDNARRRPAIEPLRLAPTKFAGAMP
jgi:hypothetical protein